MGRLGKNFVLPTFSLIIMAMVSCQQNSRSTQPGQRKQPTPQTKTEDKIQNQADANTPSATPNANLPSVQNQPSDKQSSDRSTSQKTGNPTDTISPVGTYTCLEAPEKFHCDTEEIIFQLTNKTRVDKGLQPFQADIKLAWLARDWSQQMAKANKLSHDGFPSARNQRYQEKFGVAISVPMEICAGGGGVMPKDQNIIANSMMQAWFSSQAHMDQMLNPNFKSVGIGIAPDSSGRWYTTQIFGF